MRRIFTATSSATFLALVLLLPVSTMAQLSPEQRTGRVEVGAHLGAQLATADDSAFSIAGHADYFFNQNLSLGPLIQLGFTSDLFQIGPSLQVKYTHDIDTRWKANVQGGLGFIYADLDARRDRDDTSILLPVGGGIDYRLTDYLSVGATMLFNFTDLDKVRSENFHLSLLGGLKLRF